MFELPESKCPDCGYTANAATNLEDEEQMPEPGDCSLCIKCAGIAVFNDDLMLRSPTEEELLNLPSEISAVQQLIVKLRNDNNEVH